MSLTLLDWRRRVAAMYADARAGAEEAAALQRFRAAKDELFRSHPDSPIPPERRPGFGGLAYWDPDPALRFVVPVEPMAAEIESVTGSLTSESFPLRPIGLVRLPFGSLQVYWIDVYGGGVFLPFRDGTAGDETYGAGRYLLDTVKGADLGGDAAGLVVDFNYAYHPSCTYDPRWSCPLAPPANRLSVPVRAGERLLAGHA